jgi:hypothetical protein
MGAISKCRDAPAMSELGHFRPIQPVLLPVHVCFALKPIPRIAAD